MVILWSAFVKPWLQIVLLIAVAVAILLPLGPVIGAPELAIWFAVVALGIVLILRRARKKDAAN